MNGFELSKPHKIWQSLLYLSHCLTIKSGHHLLTEKEEQTTVLIDWSSLELFKALTEIEGGVE